MLTIDQMRRLVVSRCTGFDDLLLHVSDKLFELEKKVKAADELADAANDAYNQLITERDRAIRISNAIEAFRNAGKVKS